MLKYSIERELAKRFGPVHAKVMKPSFYSSGLSDSTGRRKRLKSPSRKRSLLILNDATTNFILEKKKLETWETYIFVIGDSVSLLQLR